MIDQQQHFQNAQPWLYVTRFDTQQVDMNKRNQQELDQQERQMRTLLKAQEQLLEFKNQKMVKKKEIENEENRYITLLSLDN